MASTSITPTKWRLPVAHKDFSQKKSYVRFYMNDKLVLLISDGSFLVSYITHRLIIPTHTLIILQYE